MGRGDYSVMGIVEEYPQVPITDSALTHFRNQVRSVPLMDNHDIRVADQFFNAVASQVIRPPRNSRKSFRKLRLRTGAVLAFQISPAPAVCRFQALHLEAADRHIRQYATKKMRVPMIPVRNDGVAK